MVFEKQLFEVYEVRKRRSNEAGHGTALWFCEKERESSTGYTNMRNIRALLFRTPRWKCLKKPAPDVIANTPKSVKELVEICIR